jgi:aminoglycoside phosphotransferase family enzyme/predicted kinase
MSADPQAETCALLADPATHGGIRPERIDTHISTVFLAGELAYKLKKAVKLPFLDFSTLEARLGACQAELEINRRAAPRLYLGIKAVMRRADGRLALGGEGVAEDYVVAMRRFDGDDLFDRLAARGALDRRLLDRLTAAIVAYHAGAERRPDHGGAAGLEWTIASNARSMAPAVPGVLPAAGVASLTEVSRHWLERLAPLLDERRAGGLVRRCHGDLHLGNICLFEGEPTLFDAIEFSDDIACVDVFYDLAFLLMDLDVRGTRPLASLVMNRALDLTGDYPAMAALPLFLSLRAGVRAMVAATIALSLTGPARETKTGEARRYLAAALAYLEPPPPRLVAIGGLSGSGKSRMGRLLAPLLGAPGAAVVRSDALRKQLMGSELGCRLGPEGYSEEVTRRTYQALFDTCASVLRAGHPVIADGVFARPEQRAAIRAVAEAAGTRFDGLWLEAAPEVAAGRIERRVGDASDATVEVLERQRGYELGRIDWHRLDTGRSEDDAPGDARRVLEV